MTTRTYPLTSLQQGMIYHHLLDSRAGTDIEQIVITLPEALDVRALRVAFAFITARHEQLRTSYRWEGVDEPVQEVHELVVVPIREEDLSGLSADTRVARLDEVIVQERRDAFDLREPGVQKAVILHFGPNDWRLVWTMHHLVFDGTTQFILIQELFAHYDAERRGTTAAVLPSRPYADFVAWTRAQDFAASEPLWRERLKGFTSPTRLPSAQSSPDAVHRQGDRVAWLSDDTTAALERAGVDHGFTMNILAQALWAILLARHAGEDDVVYGAVRGGRRSSLPEAPEMVGMFINTLTMRVRLDPEQSLIELLKAVRLSWDELRPVEHTPLRMAQGWSDIEGGSPLFNSLVVYQNYDLDLAFRELGGEWASRSFRVYQQPPVELSLSVRGQGKTRLAMGFDRARVDDATADRLFGQLVALFTSAAENPRARIRELNMLPAAERRLVLETFNDTALDVPAATIHGLIDAQVAAQPNAVALRFDGESLTFREFDARAERIAAGLHRAGVGHGDIVALCVERSFDFPVGVYGILKAGGAWLPLDPSYPTDRLEYMLEDSGAPVLLTQRALAGRSHRAPVTCFVEDLVADPRTRDEAAPVSSPDDLAYVIYTSGSTGKPKGAKLLHRGAVNLAAALAREFETTSTDRILQFSALSFDASVLELVWSVCQGSRLVLAPHDVIVNPESLAELIEREGVTGSLMPPVMLRVLEPSAVPSFMAVVSGGDACGADVVDRWAAGRRFYNAYGPTEITVAATVARCHEGAGRTPPIGGPLANCTAYVLDPHGALVPIGVSGELWIGGAGVGAGYLNRPELTAERFVADPFAATPGARMYRSGDSVVWRPDGQLDYLGRLDDQVKLRGFRIELGEIEARIAKLPGVRDVVVSLREDVPGDKRLVAYVVPVHASDAPSPGALRSALASELPAYMVPTAFVTLDAFPLAPSGKIDRRRLPAAGAEHLASDDSTYVAPRNDAEQRLATLWAQVLRVPRVGVHDNFFELGGDSILNMQVVARARPAGIAFTPKMLFQNQTIEALVHAIEAAGGFASGAVVAGEQGPERGEAPLTPIQHWFFEQDVDDAHWWNQSFMFSSREPLNGVALDEAVRAVVSHHDALRLRYARDGNAWRQWYAEGPGETSVVQVDLADVGDDALAESIDAHANGVQSGLDLAAGPMIRVAYFDLGRGRGIRLLFAIHHLVVDGVSWRILLEDLEQAYEQRLRGEDVALPSRTTSFKQWGERLDQCVVSGSVRSELAYWNAVCAPVAGALPFERPDGSRHESDMDVATVWLEAGETRTLLQRVPAAYNTRIDDVLVSALAITLGGWAGGESILLDMEGHGREDVVDGVDLSRTVGWFTSIFPIRLDLAAARGDAMNTLRTIKDQLRGIPNRGLGFGVLRYLSRESSLATDGQVAFNYLGQFDQVVSGSKRFAFAPERAGAWRSPRAQRRHPIDVLGLVSGGRLEIRWNYSRGVVDGATVAKLSAEYVRVLRELIARCTAPGAGGYTPSDFPLATIDQAALDHIAGSRRDIEDIYPLVGVQKLFYGFADRATDPGFERFHFRLTGRVDVSAMRAAWMVLVARNPIFRTAFLSEGPPQPLQVVYRTAELPFVEQDWRPLSADEQAHRMTALLEADRAHGFEFDRAPLMRFTLVRLSDDVYELLWSHHHLLLDGWSLPLVLDEVTEAYVAHRSGTLPDLPVPVRYRDYVAWLGRQDIKAAESYWRRVYAQYVPATPLHDVLNASPGADAHEAVDVRLTLSAEETAEVNTLARELRVPRNAVVQGAWAIWLARQLRSTDVVFGLALAGRPAEVTGVDRMIGVTIGNLPLRIHLEPDATLGAFINGAQVARLELQQFAHSPLERVQEWSGVPWRLRLFESMLVFQHHRVAAPLRTWLGDDAKIEVLNRGTETAYPLTITVTGDDALSFQVTGDERLFGLADAQSVAEGLRATLLVLASNQTALVRDVLERLPAPGVARDPALTNGDASRAAHRVAPRTPTETVLTRIWGDLLGVADLGVTDNFLERGGHSLLATQLVSRVRDTFQLQVSVRMLFQSPTVAEFANAMRAIERKPGQVDRIAQLVQRVEGMSPEQLRQAAAARKRTTQEKSTADGH